MVITQSKLTDQDALIPAEILRRLGAGPGTVLEWEEDGEQIIVRRADGYTSEDIHHALFPKPPKARKVKEMKEGIRQHIKERYARRWFSWGQTPALCNSGSREYGKDQNPL